MGRDFAEAIPECAALFERADAVLGYGLSEICFDGPQETLNRSNHAQLGLFVASAAALKALELREGLDDVAFFAGHSLGEWTALYAAGVVRFDDALRVLRARGEAMQAACDAAPGAMLAVMGLDGEALEKLAEEAGCHVANFNSTVQTVLSGTADSIERVEAAAKEAGAKRTVRLPVAGAFHSPLMRPAAERFAEFLGGVELMSPRRPVFSNATAAPHDPAAIKENMVRQIVSSVRWTELVRNLMAEGVEETIECGPGKVLAGLIKRIDKRCPVRNIGQLADLKGN